jgi:hypothetical protein
MMRTLKKGAGTAFKYVGNPTDVSEGDFDLDYLAEENRQRRYDGG